jgi:3-deoxy-D-manno-octulosonic-acid transferase
MVLIDFILFRIYRHAVYPAALWLLHFFSCFLPAKLKEMISDRDFKNLQALPARPIWIHASSGEIEYAKSVIRKLREKFPQSPVMVTYFSPSAKKLIKNFPGIDLAMALPWDKTDHIEKFLEFYKPRCVLFARTDVWPNLTVELKQRKIPAVLFSATFAEQSSRQGLIAGSLTRTALNNLDRIFCVSLADQENLQKLGIKIPMEISGDTRFDQVLYRLNHPQTVKKELSPSREEKIFVAGSTWPTDETVLLPSLKTWKKLGGRTILVPHEHGAERIQDIQKQIKALGLSCSLYSEATEWESDVLLVDEVGHLQELYSWGSCAFIGGSFKDKVHSVMEALCVGIPVAVGPYFANNREAVQFQHVLLATNLFAVNVVNNQPELESLLGRIVNLHGVQPKIIQKVQQSTGTTDRLIEWIQEQTAAV